MPRPPPRSHVSITTLARQGYRRQRVLRVIRPRVRPAAIRRRRPAVAGIRFLQVPVLPWHIGPVRRLDRALARGRDLRDRHREIRDAPRHGGVEPLGASADAKDTREIVGYIGADGGGCPCWARGVRGVGCGIARRTGHAEVGVRPDGAGGVVP